MVEPPKVGRRWSPEITLAVLVALVVAAFVGLAAWVIGQAYTTTIGDAEGNIVRLSQRLDESAGRFLREQERFAVHVVGDALKLHSNGHDHDGGGLREHIAHEHSEILATMGVVDGHGRVVLVTDDRLRPVLDAMIARSPATFAPPLVGEHTSLTILRPAVVVASLPAPILLCWRVVGAEGGFGVAVAAVDSDQLRALVAGPVGFRSIRIGLVGLDGEPLFQSSAGKPEAGMDLIRQAVLPDRLRESSFGAYRVPVGPSGGLGLVAFRKVGRFPVAAVAVVEEVEVLRPWFTVFGVGIVVVFGLSAVLILLAVLHIRAVGRSRRDLEQRVRERTREQQWAAERLMAAERLTHLGHWEHDLVTGQAHWSAEIYRLLGLAPGEHYLEMRDVLNAIHPDDRDDECTARILASAGVKPYDVQFRIIRSDKTVRHVHAQAEVLRDDKDEPIRLIGTILDITERKQVESALDESNAALLTAINATREDSVLLVGVDGIVQVANERATRSFGLDAAITDLHGRELLELVPPDSRAQWQRRLAQVVADGKSQRFEHSRGGAVFDAHFSPAFDSGDRQVGVAVFERDITARKQAESDLRLLTRAIEQSPLSVIITDRTGRIEYVNPYFIAATGYSFAEVAGKDPSL